MQNKPRLANLTAVVKKIATNLALPLVLLVLACPAIPQQSPEAINIHVQADQSDGPIPPKWSYWGYDEPNYTYAPDGKKLLAEFAALSPVPVYVRVHNLFTTGDGSASLHYGVPNR